MRLLDAIQEQREQEAEEHERRLRILGEIEDLAGQLHGTPAEQQPALQAPTPPPAQEQPALPSPARAPRPTAASAEELRDRLEQIVRAVQKHQPAALRQVIAETGLTTNKARRALAALVEKRVLTTVGRGPHTRYWVTADRDQLEAETNGTCGHGGGAEARDLRRRVAAAINADPGQLNDERLAQHLRVDPSRVAAVTGDLMTDGALEMTTDGCWFTVPEDRRLGEPPKRTSARSTGG